jgi:hypothetical protein
VPDAPQTTKRLGFSGDGRRLVVVSMRGEVLAWELPSGQRLPGEPGAGDWPADPFFSPDGTRLARLDGDLVVIHDLKPPDADELDWRRIRTAFDAGWHELNPAWWEGAWQPAFCWSAGVWHLDRLLADRPDELSLRQRRGQALAEVGRWAQARDDFAVLTRRMPHKPGDWGELTAWRGLALTQLADGQVGAYRQTCEQLLRRFTGWVHRLRPEPRGHTAPLPPNRESQQQTVQMVSRRGWRRESEEDHANVRTRGDTNPGTASSIKPSGRAGVSFIDTVEGCAGPARLPALSTWN